MERLEASDKFLKNRDRVIGFSLVIIIVEFFELSGTASILGVQGLKYEDILLVCWSALLFLGAIHFIRLREEISYTRWQSRKKFRDFHRKYVSANYSEPDDEKAFLQSKMQRKDLDQEIAQHRHSYYSMSEIRYMIDLATGFGFILLALFFSFAW